MRISDWSSDVCSSDLASARGEDHDHLTAFHARLVLDLCHRLEVGLHLLQELHPQFRVGELAAAEAQCDLHLVALFEEARSEERRVGKECGSTFKYRGFRDH